MKYELTMVVGVGECERRRDVGNIYTVVVMRPESCGVRQRRSPWHEASSCRLSDIIGCSFTCLCNSLQRVPLNQFNYSTSICRPRPNRRQPHRYADYGFIEFAEIKSEE